MSETSDALTAVAAQREATPGRPEDGPYPASVGEVADEVVAWIKDMDGTSARNLTDEVLLRLAAPPAPTPAQWAAWFRCCADEADEWELSADHREVFRRIAEHFEDGRIVTRVAGITGVDS